ncbi:MAG TPA: GNAT family N-acetyltransferase [Streptosporangiaceae bacterium]
MLSVRLANSLSEIDAAEWGALVSPGGFYLSHEWLRLVEADSSASAEYLIASDGQRIIAALPVYDVNTEPLGLYQPERLADGRWHGHYLLVGARRGFVNGVLAHPDLDAEQRDEAFRLLLAAVAERVTARGADGALFLHLTTVAANELLSADRDACAANVPVLTIVDSAIDVPGHSMDDYLDVIPSQYRRKIRREMRVFEAADYQIAEERLGDCLPEAGSLVCNLQHRYGHMDDDELWRTELGQMAELLAARGVVFSCRYEGALAGFALGYPQGGTLYMRRCGFDYGLLRDAFEYFNLGYYLPLRYAYRHGLKRLHLGPTAYEAKVRRGAVLAPLWGVAVCSAAQTDDDAALGWNRKAASEWLSSYGQGSATLNDAGWARWGCG